MDSNVLSPLLFFSLLYLGLQLLKGLLFWFYLIQLKEYRKDRLLAHLRTKTGRKQVFNYFNLLNWNRLYYPRFTIRMMFMVLASLFSLYHVFFLLLRLVFSLIRDIPFSIAFSLLATLTLINFLLPTIVVLLVEATKIILWPFKRLILFLAEKKRVSCKNLIVIGVTGSYGKTAVKEILGFMLEDDFRVLKTPANCNTKLGIALFMLKRLKVKDDVFVVEMGAYKRGEIEEICKIVKPEIGIVTGINAQHMELFGSIGDIQWAKFELIKALPEKGLAVFNGGSHYVQRLIKATNMNKRIYGIKEREFQTGLLGDWHNRNIEAALEVGEYLGVPRKRMLAKIKKIKKIILGIEKKKGKDDVLIIDDSYSANPTGFLKALQFFKKVDRKKKVLITPGIIELGKKSSKTHRRIAKKAVSVCSKIFLTKPDFEDEFKSGLKAKQKKKIEVETDILELVKKLKPFLNSKGAILIEGRVSELLLKRLLG